MKIGIKNKDNPVPSIVFNFLKEFLDETSNEPGNGSVEEIRIEFVSKNEIILEQLWSGKQIKIQNGVETNNEQPN